MGRVRHDHRPDGRAQGRRPHAGTRPQLPVGEVRGDAPGCMFAPSARLVFRSSADCHVQVFRNPKPDLVALLEQTGGDANGVRGKTDPSKKKVRRDKAVRRDQFV